MAVICVTLLFQHATLLLTVDKLHERFAPATASRECLPIHTYLSGFYPIFRLSNILSHIRTPLGYCKNILLISFFPKLSEGQHSVHVCLVFDSQFEGPNVLNNIYWRHSTANDKHSTRTRKKQLSACKNLTTCASDRRLHDATCARLCAQMMCDGWFQNSIWCT